MIVVAIGWFVVWLSLMIFVHELGHLLAAKWAGIPCHKFSLGFGPRVVGFQWGKTEYQLSLIPLGGYVKMTGEDDGVQGRQERPFGLANQSAGVRAVVLSSGVAMNLLLGLGIYLGLALHGGQAPTLPAQFQKVEVADLPAMTADSVPASSPATETRPWRELPTEQTVVSVDGRNVESWEEAVTAILAQTDQRATLQFENGATFTGAVPEDDEAKLQLVRALLPPLPTVVGKTLEGGLAQQAGLQTGDHLLSLKGHSVDRYVEWVRVAHQSSIIETTDHEPIELVFRRNGTRHTRQLRPDRAPAGTRNSSLGWLGARLGEKRTPVNTLEATQYASTQVKKDFQRMAESARLIGSGAIGVDQLSGPVKMAEIARQAFEVSWYQFLSFMAFISINLAIMNYLPIPGLDGGHMLLLVIEKIRGRPFSDRWMSRINKGGVGFVFLLMGLIIVNDIVQLGGFF